MESFERLLYQVDGNGLLKSEEGKPVVQESNELQEQRRLQGYLAEFRSMYDSAGWPWPVIAGPSSESGIDRLRREVNALQPDGGSCTLSFGFDTEVVPAEPAPASYSLEELKAMVPEGGLQCPVCQNRQGLWILVGAEASCRILKTEFTV